MKNSLKTGRDRRGLLLLATLETAIFLLLLLRSDIAIEYMNKGLKLCVYTVIPSLFPFMVISELIVSSGVIQRLGRAVSGLFRLLFGVGENEGCACLLGAICGFPIGARTLCTMYDRGMISREEAERALTFCNNPGSAFVISAVGGSLFGSRQLGVMLYACVLLSAVAVGILGRLFFKKSEHTRTHSALVRPTEEDGILAFVAAIRNSAASMLTVCACVAFFSSLVGCLGAMLEGLRLPKALLAALFGFFEISGGAGMAAETEPLVAAILLCAAGLGWSGLSVHLQIAAICAGRGLSLKPYFIAKAAQGMLCALIMGVMLKLFPLSENTFLQFEQAGERQTIYANAAFVACVFFAATVCPLLLSLVRKGKKKIFQKSETFFQKGLDKSNFV